VLLTLLARSDLAVVLVVVGLGTAGFVLNPAIYGRVFTIAAAAPTLAGSTAVSMFQLGISLVPLFAGAALTAGAGLTAIPWIGAGLALLTVPVVLADRALSTAAGEKPLVAADN
jgi:DHA1 family chloramphenicol resistance protein-like MFS transporter